jgi:GT2 family glycosyltransferase
MIDEAVIICTRNRPDDLGRLLSSLAEQGGMHRRLVLIVDASEDSGGAGNWAILEHARYLNVKYLRYLDRPSLARQRNFGVDALPETIDIVHFLDDDVTLESGCLDCLTAAFSDVDVFGAGGRVEVPGKSVQEPSLPGRLFLLDSARNGVVLASGAGVSGQIRGKGDPFDTEWLGGCASYRREILVTNRFDSALEGYSLDEDLDLSYRVGRKKRLRVVPEALLYHHESATERASLRDYSRDYLVHRYWFLEKNVRHPLKKAAFWWSTIGRLMAALVSSEETSGDELAGLIAGAKIVWNRADPLLSHSQ